MSHTLWSDLSQQNNSSPWTWLWFTNWMQHFLHVLKLGCVHTAWGSVVTPTLIPDHFWFCFYVSVNSNGLIQIRLFTPTSLHFVIFNLESGLWQKWTWSPAVWTQPLTVWLTVLMWLLWWWCFGKKISNSGGLCPFDHVLLFCLSSL